MKEKNLYRNPLSVLIWWYDLAVFALMFPSNSVIVFLRYRLGYRLMQPWIFYVTFLGLMFLNLLSVGSSALRDTSPASRPAAYYGARRYVPSSPYALDYPATVDAPPAEQPSLITPLFLFAVGMGGLVFYHRRKGWELVFAADPLHTMSRGTSYLTQILPFPARYRQDKEYYIQTYIEPFLCMGLGYILLRSYPVFGAWFMLSGYALMMIEGLINEEVKNNFLDRCDQAIEARLMQETDREFQNRNAPKPAEKIGNIRVIASPEMRRLRAERLATMPTEEEQRRYAEARRQEDAAYDALMKERINNGHYSREATEEATSVQSNGQ